MVVKCAFCNKPTTIGTKGRWHKCYGSVLLFRCHRCYSWIVAPYDPMVLDAGKVPGLTGDYEHDFHTIESHLRASLRWENGQWIDPSKPISP